MCRLAGHCFWYDDVELVTGGELDLDAVNGHRQVTDAHLLALCSVRAGRLVTFDRALQELAPDQALVQLLTV